jgi:hypothetical protein
VEEAGDGDRVCQALPGAHDAHRWCLWERGRGAVRDDRRGRERKGVRRRQFWCVGRPLVAVCSDALPLHHRHCRSDMINIIKLGFTPKACCWVHRRGQAQSILAMYDLPLITAVRHLAYDPSAQTNILVLSDYMMAAATKNH